MCACRESDDGMSDTAALSLARKGTVVAEKRSIHFTLARVCTFISANDSFCDRQLQQRYGRNDVSTLCFLPGFLVGWTPCSMIIRNWKGGSGYDISMEGLRKTMTTLSQDKEWGCEHVSGWHHSCLLTAALNLSISSLSHASHSATLQTAGSSGTPVTFC
jgi:hypothetical protein